MIKPTPNPPQNEATSPYESLDSKKLHEAAERALDHHFAPPPGDKPKPRKGNLFAVSPDIDTEALLANASEDLLSISAIAANLADDVDGARCSGLMKPDTHLGENARQIEVSDDQTTPFLFC
ncbi:DUF6124 family protein [Pseudomonas sp. BGI-2]|uniref:DUF6124 family protein n=1 Tax=Pseudomonas sp. BGI-2 TaxID=2528211 RepID=UPI0021142092|nr:hypothetical protein [Pseudomonas sp. BGI-2]